MMAAVRCKVSKWVFILGTLLGKQWDENELFYTAEEVRTARSPVKSSQTSRVATRCRMVALTQVREGRHVPFRHAAAHGSLALVSNTPGTTQRKFFETSQVHIMTRFSAP